jgi:hypothetical protein
MLLTLALGAFDDDASSDVVPMMDQQDIHILPVAEDALVLDACHGAAAVVDLFPPLSPASWPSISAFVCGYDISELGPPDS